MKTLKLLLLFLPLSLFGQQNEIVSSKEGIFADGSVVCCDTIQPLHYSIGGDSIVLYTERDILDIRIRKFAEDFLRAYGEYEKECYNDSTYKEVYVDPNISTEIAPGVYSTTLMGGYYVKRWVRKQPSFSGFIEYLKNFVN